jgi:hypothetical protein
MNYWSQASQIAGAPRAPTLAWRGRRDCAPGLRHHALASPLRGMNSSLRAARMTRRSLLLLTLAVVSLLVSAYAFLGVLQAAMLFQGLRALRNANLWGSLSLAAFMAAILMLARALQFSLPRGSALLGVLLLSVAAYALAPILGELRVVDACLDGGGSFDYLASKCSSVVTHPHIPFLQRRGFQLVAGALFASGGVCALAGAVRVRPTQAAL